MAAGKATDKVKIGAQQRRLKVLELRRGGGSLRAISAQLGVSHMQVKKDLDHGLRELLKLEVAGRDELRALDLDRLDSLILASWKSAVSGDIQAGQLILKIIERRAHMLGLDAPVKVETTVGFTEEAWLSLRGAVLTALAAFPEARVAVARHLMLLEAAKVEAEQAGAVEADYTELSEVEE